MARPIKETPILFGEDARIFEEKMRNVKNTETPEQRASRLSLYEAILQCLKRGEEVARKRSLATNV